MRLKKIFLLTLVSVGLISLSSLALAAGDVALDGKTLGLVWILPFVGMLLSIAFVPLAAPHFWEKNIGKASVFWILCFLVPALIVFGFKTTAYTALHTLVLDYIPYIILLGTLFTIAGGIRVKGHLVGTPKLNVTILLIGSCLASFMGTTGAAVLFIRPLLRANAHRRYRVHTVMFFIFLVANIGGSLTPLGDPPLFLGFLKGVPFFWTMKHLLVKTMFLVATLLVVYFIVDSYFYKKEGSPLPDDEGPQETFGIDGKINFLLLAIVVFTVFMSGYWESGIVFKIWGHVQYTLQGLIRDVGLIFLSFLSMKLTATITRRGNDFSWGPILEVGKIFLGIFITMYPVLVILQAGHDGALKQVVALVTMPDGGPNNILYFWISGWLSAFLDNAPTYLVFFNMALTSNDVTYLLNEVPQTLTAISAGTVFMGAITYIGNAPNFMVKAIADEQGVKMPSFFGYMFWTVVVLVPLYFILTKIFFS